MKSSFQSVGVGILVILLSVPTFTRAQADSAADDAIVKLSPFDVSSKGDRGYSSANTVGATLINSPIKDTPMSLSVLNSEFLKDVGAIDPVDAATYVSGVAAAGAPGSGQLTVRGQNIPGANIRDGVQDLSWSGGAILQDLALTERVEVIKGPEGTLYGSYSGQGGLVNLVTKAPEAVNRTTLSAMIGSDDLGGMVYRGVYDTTGTAPNNPNLEYRLIVVGEKGQTYQRGPDNTFVISPMVKYSFGGGGSILLRYMYQNPDRGTNEFDWFADASGRYSTFIDPKQSIPELDAGRYFRVQTADLDFNQPFQTGPIHWDSRVYVRYDHAAADWLLYEQPLTSFLFLNSAGQTIGNANNTLFSDPNLATILVSPRTRKTMTDATHSMIENFDLVGSCDLGPVNNKLLMYGDTLNSTDLALSWGDGTYPGIVIWSKLPTNPGAVHQPDPAAAQALTGPTLLTGDTNTVTTLNSVGAQDSVSFLHDHLILVAGIRSDRQNQTTENFFAKSFIYGDVRTGTTHKYGIVAEPVKPVTLFFNYSQTFAPNGIGSDVNGNPYKLPNLNSTIYEEGAKFSLIKDTLFFTASYFRTITEDALVTASFYDAQGVGKSVQIPAGEQTIRGWETDGTWTPWRSFSLLFGAGNLTAKTATNLAARGVPYGTNYRLFGKYTFNQTGWIDGAFIGGGLQHNGPRAADATDDAILPAYTVVNTVAGYNWGHHWTAQVNVQNLFNETYVSVGISRQIAYAGLPRNASFNFTYSY